MRIPKELTELINKYDEENLTFKDVAKEDIKESKFREIDVNDNYNLLKNNILLPFGDAFEYNNFGVLLTGKSEIGKTTTMENIVSKENIYSQDRPTLYKNDKLYIFKDDIKSINYPFFAPFLFPDDKFDYVELKYLINICETNELEDSYKICDESQKKEIIDFITFQSVNIEKTEDAANLAYKLFEDVEFYNFKRTEKNKKGYESIKELLSLK